MRREGNIIQEIIEHRNMSDSFDQVLRGTVRKTCREGRELLARREEVIANLQCEIADGSFKVTEYREREIYEYGKHRILQIVPWRGASGATPSCVSLTGTCTDASYAPRAQASWAGARTT